MHIVAQALEAVGIIVCVVLVVAGAVAWLLSGLKPGDMP
jgi:hypothetical protein